MAQIGAGIQRVVTDVQGVGVPDAAVTLTSNETKIARTTKTNETGAYAIPALPPGVYSLSVEKTGFSKKVLEQVVIQAEHSHLNVEGSDQEIQE